MNTNHKDAIHRVSDITRVLNITIIKIAICIVIAYTGLSAQASVYKDIVFLKDGTVLVGVKTKVTKEMLEVTKQSEEMTEYRKADISEVLKNAYDLAKGYKDLVVLKDGNLLNQIQTFVTKSSLLVITESGQATVYPKAEVAEVKRNAFDKTKGFGDVVTLKDETVLNGVQTLVSKDSLIVFTEDGTAKIYSYKEVSGVKKNAYIKEESATGETYTSKAGIEFVKIPAGEFMMGCSEGDNECDSNEKPAHKVKITKSFYMGKYEVTQGQWKAVMGKKPSYFVGAYCDLPSCDNHPVEQVSWNDIQEFLKKLNSSGKGKYRLPTEAEWEYAARAGTTTTYYWGYKLSSGFLGLGSTGLEYLWYDGKSGDKTHPVGQKKPNAFVLYDMSGNVWEWVEDWYDSDYYTKSTSNDPTGPSSGSYRVLRGGSWRYDAGYSRSSSRYDSDPDYRDSYRGLRVVLLP